MALSFGCVKRTFNPRAKLCHPPPGLVKTCEKGSPSCQLTRPLSRVAHRANMAAEAINGRPPIFADDASRCLLCWCGGWQWMGETPPHPRTARSTSRRYDLPGFAGRLLPPHREAGDGPERQG